VSMVFRADPGGTGRNAVKEQTQAFETPSPLILASGAVSVTHVLQQVVARKGVRWIVGYGAVPATVP
jgi:hypothetical protein